MQHEIIGLFPTPLHITHIGREITEQELEVCNKHLSTALVNVGNKVSETTNLLDSELPEIKKFIEQCIDHYVKEVIVPGNNSDVEFYITQSWLNWTDPGQHHHPHKHPNSIISGVFYLSGEGESDSITFVNTNKQDQLVFSRNSEHHNIWNSNTWWMPANTGDCFLFPSTTEHQVQTTTSGKTRISIAFNVFIKGTIGDNRALTLLHL